MGVFTHGCIYTKQAEYDLTLGTNSVYEEQTGCSRICSPCKKVTPHILGTDWQ